MARVCAICGKRPQVARLVSNANNKVKRWVYPNVHTMRFTKSEDGSGKVFRDKVCTKCFRAGKVKKVV